MGYLYLIKEYISLSRESNRFVIVNNVQRQRSKKDHDAEYFVSKESDREGLTKIFINESIGMCLDLIEF